MEIINDRLLKDGGTPDQFRARIARATGKGWLWQHESGAYMKFTPAGTELFT